ncbi:MAG: MsnO8 family LLM class oxidoreductase [Turicibacter sp.]|nr:MsnO8 family LLM class oxidoreductase [Turicibacter sp.]
MGYTLGILDQSPLMGNATNEQIIGMTVDLAQKAENWGYSRFWVSEHHNTPELIGSSPEVLASYLLAKTKTIKIGSGGVMLQHYSPYKVAENFNLLSTLAPGRVDLGVGKAPGGLPLSTKALQHGTINDGSDFDNRLKELQQYVKGYGEVIAVPVPKTAPRLVLLGASAKSAELAGQLGIGFVFAGFINTSLEVLQEAATLYKKHHPAGHFAVGMAVMAADTADEAKSLAVGKKLVKVHLDSGRTLTVADMEMGHQFGKESGEGYTLKEFDANIFHGTAADVHTLFETYHERFKIDEFILHTPILNAAARERSFELLSPKFSAKVRVA